MSEPFIGEIRIVGFNFAPTGWAMCQGQTMSIQQNAALFSLLGTNFGGNGVQTFALPNLQGRFPLMPDYSTVQIGSEGGASSVTLNTSQLPAHNHPLAATSGKGNKPSPIGNYPAADAAGVTAEYSAGPPNGAMAPAAIGLTGGNQPVPTMPPYLGLIFIIALTGIYPARG